MTQSLKYIARMAGEGHSRSTPSWHIYSDYANNDRMCIWRDNWGIDAAGL